jgi:hypothetical protein
MQQSPKKVQELSHQQPLGAMPPQLPAQDEPGGTHPTPQAEHALPQQSP